MKNTYIFGHKNPDTDTICSALAYQIIKEKLGEETIAAKLGDINEETNYVLEYLKMEAPVTITSVKDANVIMVDHNEFSQSIDDIESGEIIEVVDHHRVANFKTESPLYMNVQPVGCTSTILYEIAKNNNVEIDEKLAVLLMSAIISDSLLFKSPTYTAKDAMVVSELRKLISFDVDAYGMEMLKAGTKLDNFTPSELINIDAKEFTTDNGKFEVAQVNTVDIDGFLNQFEEGVVSEINKTIDSKVLDMHILMVTDIVNSNSLVLVNGSKTNIFEEKFGKKLENNKTLLEGVVSRKKQIVPFL